MFDYLTGLTYNNSWVGNLTQPGGLSSFNVGNLFTPLSGSGYTLANPYTGYSIFDVGNLFTTLGANNTPWWQNSNTFSTGFTNPTFTLGSGTFGTGNFAADQALGWLSGTLSSGGSLVTNSLLNQGIAFTGGLQALPQPINGVPNFL